MRKDKEYRGELEIMAFSSLCDIKLVVCIKEFNDNNVENEEIKSMTYNQEKDLNFAVIFNKHNRERDVLNHYSSLKCKNGIPNGKLIKIKEQLQLFLPNAIK